MAFHNNNHPLRKYVSVSIIVGMAAVLVTLSSMDRPVKHKHFNFSVLRKGFKKYSHDQRVLVHILSCASKLARSMVVSDATCQACAMTSLLSMTAYWTPYIRPIFYSPFRVVISRSNLLSKIEADKASIIFIQSYS